MVAVIVQPQVQTSHYDGFLKKKEKKSLWDGNKMKTNWLTGFSKL